MSLGRLASIADMETSDSLSARRESALRQLRSLAIVWPTLAGRRFRITSTTASRALSSAIESRINCLSLDSSRKPTTSSRAVATSSRVSGVSFATSWRALTISSGRETRKKSSGEPADEKLDRPFARLPIGSPTSRSSS